MKQLLRTMSIVLVVLMLVSVIPMSVFATETPNYILTIASKSYAQLAPGVKETTVVSYDKNGDRVKYWVVEASVSTVDTIEIKANYHDNDNTGVWGKATVVEQANAATAKRGYNVVASQNAAYYNVTTGQPTGAFVMEGVNINGDSMGNATEFFAQMDDGTYMIGKRGTFSQYSDHVVEAIGGYQLLVWNGEMVATNNTSKYPRSTIGIKANGDVVTMMADGNQKPTSAGLTYCEQAQVMIELGCVAAIELDGGGSATYASKYEGESEITVRNNCCDGTVRSVSNTFMIISTAVADGTFDHANLSTDYAYYAPNSDVIIEASGADASGHAAEIPADATWALSDASFGTVENGVFTSNGKIGTVTVNMLVGADVVGSIEVVIVNPTSVAFSASEKVIPYGKTADMSVNAMYNGAEVYAAPIAYTFDFTAGTLDGFNYTAPTDESVKQTVITATYQYATGLVATTTAKFGKGSEVLFDFEDYGNGEKEFDWGTYYDLVESDYSGGYTNMYSNIGNYVASGIQEKVRLVDASMGKVHSGDYALEYTFDYRYNTEYCNWIYGYLYYWGEPITLLDTANGQMGTRLGMWMYIPEEAVGSCSRLAYTYKQANGTLNTAYLYFTYQYVEKGFSKLTSEKIPEAGWAYVSVNMSQISNSYVSTAYYKDENGNLTRAADANYAPAFIQWIISSSATGAEKCTFYIDDITLDYSDAVDDRDAPKIGNITYADTNMPDSAVLNGQTATSAKVSFAATVEEDTVHNPSGIDASSAKVYVDGQLVNSKYTINTSYKGIFAASVVLPNGTHDVTFEIADKQGNVVKTTKSIVVNDTTSTYPAIYVAGEKLNGSDPIKCGEQYNINITTDTAEAISSASMTIWLNSASTWALDHMTVAQGFNASYTLDEIACKATITVTNVDSTLTGTQILVSIPVYNFAYNSPVGISAHDQWTSYSTAPILTLSWDLQAGAVTYKSEYAVTTADYVYGFGKERIDETTELNASIANLKTSIGEWHYHTEVAVDDKAAACTEDGYTGRTVCSVCHSIIDWGTTVKATGHDYEVVDNKLVCTNCTEEYAGSGLTAVGENTYYLIGGVLQSGWLTIGDDWYYFDKTTYAGINGEVNAKTLDVGVEIMYSFTDGKLDSGVWAQFVAGKKYYYGPSYYHRVWENIDGETYHFLSKTGFAATGVLWIQDDPWSAPYLQQFAADGKYLGKYTGIYEGKYYAEGVLTAGGLVEFNGDFYYVKGSGAYVTGRYNCTNMHDILPEGYYTFGEDGKMLQGIIDGYYYVNGNTYFAGLVEIDGGYYYFNEAGKMAIGTKTCTKMNGLLPTGSYTFDENGEMWNGLVERSGNLYYYENSKLKAAGLIEVDGDYYYIRGNGMVATGAYYCTNMNGLLPVGSYTFGEDGKMWNGLVDRGGKLYYYEYSKLKAAGLVEVDGDYYYIRGNGMAVTGAYYCTNMNGLLPAGSYVFGEDGKMWNGLVERSGNLYYYENSKLKAAGLIEVDGDYYYIRGNGMVATGAYYCTNMNGLLPSGTYNFGADGKMEKVLNGLVEIGGVLRFYEGGKLKAAGLIEVDGDYYYIRGNGTAITNATYFCSNNNGLSIPYYYTFGADGKLVK